MAVWAMPGSTAAALVFLAQLRLQQGQQENHVIAFDVVHAHLPQVQWARRRWATHSYTFNGRDICVLSGPRTDAAVRSLTDPVNGLQHPRLPCHEPGPRAVQLRECHK